MILAYYGFSFEFELGKCWNIVSKVTYTLNYYDVSKLKVFP